MKAQYNFSVKKSLKDHLVQLPLRVMTKCTKGTSLAPSAFLKLPLHAKGCIQFKIPCVFLKDIQNFIDQLYCFPMATVSNTPHQWPSHYLL